MCGINPRVAVADGRFRGLLRKCGRTAQGPPVRRGAAEWLGYPGDCKSRVAAASRDDAADLKCAMQ